MILRILSFLFVFHTLLFADNSIVENSIQINSSEVVKAKSAIVKEEVEVSFSSESVVYMLVLTSLLGTFFLKDELADSI
jgi:hypothetical protein